MKKIFTVSELEEIDNLFLSKLKTDFRGDNSGFEDTVSFIFYYTLYRYSLISDKKFRCPADLSFFVYLFLIKDLRCLYYRCKVVFDHHDISIRSLFRVLYHFNFCKLYLFRKDFKNFLNGDFPSQLIFPDNYSTYFPRLFATDI